MSLFFSSTFMNHLDHLPSEVISSILNHVDKTWDLYTCTLINKTFYKYATPLLWEHLEIPGDDTLPYMTAGLEASSSLPSNSPGKFVRSVLIRHALSDDELLAFIKHVPQLNDLSLESARNITDDSFEHVPLYVPHLTRLYLGHSSITQWSIEAMRRHWYRQLNHLEFEFCDGLNYELFSALRQCKALTSLAISHCGLENNNGIDTIQDAAWNVMALPNITSFRIQDYLSNCTPFLPITTTVEQQQQQQQEWRLLPTLFPDDYFDDLPSTPTTPQQQQPVWPYLTHFFLGACEEMTDAMALAFIQSHPHLLQLELSGSPMMTDKTLDAIATYLPNIVNVNVDNVTEVTAAGIRRLMQQCPKLTTVGCDNGHIYPSDFDDVDPSSMEISYYLNGVSYVTRLYGEAFLGY
ncbi:hypothetical protein BCR42DRAFT_473949 [Absidia repens]|uniref:F-box domain-containing protein n=1 Tax=Absidia repens TaxID=90262 RepID=A0A1X2HYY4_9FUNG|nr:hypothetical protein BCR42DRAFT_473949 [Absidia repens]